MLVTLTHTFVAPLTWQKIAELSELKGQFPSTEFNIEKIKDVVAQIPADSRAAAQRLFHYVAEIDTPEIQKQIDELRRNCHAMLLWDQYELMRFAGYPHVKLLAFWLDTTPEQVRRYQDSCENMIARLCISESFHARFKTTST